MSKTLRDRRIRGLPIDKPKTFLEKYPEFKGADFYKNYIGKKVVFSQLLNEFEEILDKRFIQKSEVESGVGSFIYVGKKNEWIQKQKVKDLLDFFETKHYYDCKYDKKERDEYFRRKKELRLE